MKFFVRDIRCDDEPIISDLSIDWVTNTNTGKIRFVYIDKDSSSSKVEVMIVRVIPPKISVAGRSITVGVVGINVKNRQPFNASICMSMKNDVSISTSMKGRQKSFVFGGDAADTKQKVLDLFSQFK